MKSVIFSLLPMLLSNYENCTNIKLSQTSFCNSNSSIFRHENTSLQIMIDSRWSSWASWAQNSELKINVLFDASLPSIRIWILNIVKKGGWEWSLVYWKDPDLFKISNHHLSLSLSPLSRPLMPSALPWSMLSPFKLHHRVIISNRESHRIWFENRNTSLFPETSCTAFFAEFSPQFCGWQFLS